MSRIYSGSKMLKLALLPLVVLIVAAGLAVWALWSPLGGSSAAQAAGPHITVTKDCSLSEGGPFVGEFTFTFTITNDGDTPLIRWKADDTTLGDITWYFPETLAVGQTETVILTKLQLPNDGLCNWAEISYRTESWEVVKALPECCIGTPTPTPTPPPPGSVTLTKWKEVGTLTKPTLVCFRLDPPGDEQCKVPDAAGDATFKWENLPPGPYEIVETREVCEVQGVEEDPCTAYAPLPAIPFTMPDPPQAIVVPAPGQKVENVLQPGELCLKKVDQHGDPYTGEDAIFEVTSITDPNFPIQVHLIPSEGNPFCKTVPEGIYEICETPPPGYAVPPCQIVDALAAQTVTATFENTPEDGEGCTPGFWRNAKNGRTYWDEATDAIPIAIGLALGIDPRYVAATDDLSDFYAVFMVPPGTAGLPDPFTTDDAIRAGKGNPYKLVRHGMAALLNAAAVNYPLGIIEVKDKVQYALLTGKYEPLATDLDGFNNLSPKCPVR